MSLKTKLTSLIISFVLLASLLVVGVFAVKQTNFGLGGSIVFNAKGVEAKIELLSLSEDALLQGTAGTDVMKTVTIDSSLSDASDAKDASTWENVKLGFNEAGDDVTLQIKITNTYPTTDDVTKNIYLDITGLTDGNTIKNAKVKVRNTTSGSENGITALLAPGEHATFTVTFSVKDKGTDASIEGQLVNFDLKNLPYSEIPSYDADSRITISCNTETNTAEVTGNNITESNMSIDIPKYVRNGNIICTVSSMKSYALNHFYGGMSVSLPHTFTSIGNSAFFNCGDLVNITLPESIETIGNSAFDGCSNLTNIIIPDSVTSISDFAFSNCSGFTSIEIPSSVTSIGSNAFSFCSGLTSITIPDSVETIGGSAFLGFNGKSLIVGKNNKVYDSRNNCNAIIETATNTLITGCKNTIISNTIKAIEDYCFASCSGLTNIVIPDSVTRIGQNAFAYCTSLTEITIPSSVTTIGDKAFWNCSKIADVIIETYPKIVGSDIFIDCKGLRNVTINNGEIANLFASNTYIQKLVLGDGVTSIAGAAFSMCTMLSEVSLGKGLKRLENNTFNNCPIVNLDIPDNITTIGDQVFLVSGSLRIGSGLNSIGNDGIRGENLSSIVISEYNSVYDSRNNCNAIIESATNKLILGCKNTIIPDSVTTIGDSAFARCYTLENVNISYSVTSIGNLIFSDCYSLTDIYYAGSESEWNALVGETDIGISDRITSGALTIHYNSTGV